MSSIFFQPIKKVPYLLILITVKLGLKIICKDKKCESSCIAFKNKTKIKICFFSQKVPLKKMLSNLL